jgi:hypothetical protein
MNKTMKQISDNVDCDKSTYHNYTDIYPIFLEQFRDTEFNLFEIGIDQGKSFELWKTYFPLAKIYGMDIGKSFIDERGEVFQGDQSNINDLTNMINNIGKCKVIIDDGSHVVTHQIDTFVYLFEHMLEDNGVFIIEDIECSYWKTDATIYGYPTGHLNIVDYFTKYNHEVNHHYNKGINSLNIKTITYGANCIIITKGNDNDKIYREYKHNDLI